MEEIHWEGQNFSEIVAPQEEEEEEEEEEKEEEEDWTSRSGRFPPEKSPRTHYIRDSLTPWSGLDVWNRHISCPLLEFESRSIQHLSMGSLDTLVTRLSSNKFTNECNYCYMPQCAG